MSAPASAEALAWLSAWLQPRHLEPASLAAYRAAFAEHPARLVVLRSVLREEAAERVASFLARAPFSLSRGLYSANGPVAPARWEVAPEEDRFFRFSLLVDALRGAPAEPDLLAYLGLRRALSTPAVAGFFEAVTGLPLGAPTEPNVIAMRAGDYLRRHTDAGQRRRVAFVLYLGGPWEPAYGGALHVADRAGGVARVEPEHNSMVVFDVAAHLHHWVAPVEPAAAARARIGVGGWLLEPEPAP
jgi:hypothetical protein